jgi:glutathione S-transferase
MYHVHGTSVSSNTTKVLYVAEELGVEYEYTNMNLAKGEHKTPEHLKRHPLGKVPTLTHDGKTLFESGAICRYLASVEGSELYPAANHYQRALVDQWMNFFTCHLGKHFSSYAFETVAKEKYGFGVPNQEAAKEALGYIEQQLPCVNKVLETRAFLAGEGITIADLYAFAYSENAEMGQIPMDPYPAFAAWYAGLRELESVQRAYKRLGRQE